MCHRIAAAATTAVFPEPFAAFRATLLSLKFKSLRMRVCHSYGFIPKNNSGKCSKQAALFTKAALVSFLSPFLVTLDRIVSADFLDILADLRGLFNLRPDFFMLRFCEGGIYILLAIWGWGGYGGLFDSLGCRCQCAEQFR